jgi:hypothetical protein
VATAEQVKEWQARRGGFLSAIWDSEHAGIELPLVSDLLDEIGASDLPAHQIDRLVRDLEHDGMISQLTMGPIPEQQIRLTSEGRYEVEQWLAEPDEPTDYLSLPASQAFHINTMNVTGPALLGSTANNVTTSYGASGKELVELVAQFRQLLTAAELSPDDREGLEADLDVLEEEAATPQPRPQRVRPILRRLKGALLTGALSGAQVAAKQETIHWIEMADKALTG